MQANQNQEMPEQSLPELMRAVLARLAAGEDFKIVATSTGIQARVEEAIAAIQEPDFVSNETVHSAMVSWFWTDDRLHDGDYADKVQDAAALAANVAKKKYGVQINTDLRCQWEGIEFLGDSLFAVTAAADHVAKRLKRFKGVRSLGI